MTWATWSSPCHIRVQGLRVELLQRRMPEVRGYLIMLDSLGYGLVESLVLGPAADAIPDRRLPAVEQPRPRLVTVVSVIIQQHNGIYRASHHAAL